MKLIVFLGLLLVFSQALNKDLNLVKLYEHNSFDNFLKKFSAPQFQILAQTNSNSLSDLMNADGVQGALNIDVSNFNNPCLKESEFDYYFDYFSEWHEVLSEPSLITSTIQTLTSMRDAYQTILDQQRDMITNLAIAVTEPRYGTGYSFIQKNTEPLVYSKTSQQVLQKKTVNTLGQVSLLQTAAQQRSEENILTATQNLIDSLNDMIVPLQTLADDESNFQDYLDQFLDKLKQVNKVKDQCVDRYTPENERPTNVYPSGYGLFTDDNDAVVKDYESTVDVPEDIEESFPDAYRDFSEVVNDIVKDACQSRDYYEWYIDEAKYWQDTLKSSDDYSDEIDMTQNLIEKTGLLIDLVTEAEGNSLFVTYEKDAYETSYSNNPDICTENSTTLLSVQKDRYQDILASLQELAANKEDEVRQIDERYAQLYSDWLECYGNEDQQNLIQASDVQTKTVPKKSAEKVNLVDKKVTKKTKKLRKN